MDQPDTSNVQPTYNQSYDEIVTRIMANMITSKPLDRELLARFAREVNGPTCDLGCGVGHVARYLYELGISIYGIDPSPRNISLARRASPGIEFRLGDIVTLDIEDNSLGGVVDFYSTLTRFSRQYIVSILHEICRVLQPRGLLLLAFHQGQHINPEDWWGYSDLIDGFFFERDIMEGDLQDSGFDIEESIVRPPYPKIEVQTERVYIFARKRP
jgi:SAM-dependent methyltransferase